MKKLIFIVIASLVTFGVLFSCIELQDSKFTTSKTIKKLEVQPTDGTALLLSQNLPSLYDSTANVPLTPTDAENEQKELLELALIADASAKLNYIEFQKAEKRIKRLLGKQNDLVAEIENNIKLLEYERQKQDSTLAVVRYSPNVTYLVKK